MELRQLEYFVAIAKEGSLTTAAKVCRIAQPSLSQQLRALEEEFGEPLMHRKPRGVEPTAAGKILLEHAERLLDEARRLRERFEQRRESHEGRVIFGVIPTLAPYLLPKILRPFRDAYPKVEVQVREALTNGLIQQVVDGSIEFAILSDVLDQDRKKWSLHVKELFREPLLLALPTGHSLARSVRGPRPDQLSSEDLIHLKDGHCLTDRTLKVCRLTRFDQKLECDQLETALAMVAAGMGIAVVPELAARSHSKTGVTFKRFGNPVPERTVSIMRRRSSDLSKPAKELLNLLQHIPAEWSGA
ncbi:LysR family transcriptional regulator [Luteolibacter pohnpeiensis]|uniref:LysR family transcriptional regulator n=1 Tax=Luteolibacter pohnpeiensis TaxID=454153 RepID=A0A934VRI7_9BACT|nr:LysR substrate-binding domain-containing protein [Luteolibacter pohnpeiensis]MBK1883251.1 LysR family transcriptional regulator [Luteolibacter pohnpeiensis]